MSLATRCTDCGTVFRVVRDQLKVSEGWVRCGRCSAVFNALEGLFDLEATTPQESPSARQVQDELSHHTPAPTTIERAAATPEWSAPAAPQRHEPEPALDPDLAFDAAAPIASAIDDTTPTIAAPVSAPSAGEPELDRARDSAPAVQVDADEMLPRPQFVLAADRAAFWRRPRVRAALAAAALLLGATLGLQAALASRDVLAAQWPALRPVLAALCQAGGCRIEPLRRIEGLSLDSSGLTRVEGAPLYRLSLSLRNRADTALLAPALELALTDGQGQMIARRVLQPAELGLATAVIEAGRELPLQVLLAPGERRISGYSVELFYP